MLVHNLLYMWSLKKRFGEMLALPKISPCPRFHIMYNGRPGRCRAAGLHCRVAHTRCIVPTVVGDKSQGHRQRTPRRTHRQITYPLLAIKVRRHLFSSPICPLAPHSPDVHLSASRVAARLRNRKTTPLPRIHDRIGFKNELQPCEIGEFS